MDMRKIYRRSFDELGRSGSKKMAIPDEISEQLERFVLSLYEIENNNMIGVYLHGSLAMGCFHPQHSDLDLLALLEEPAPCERRNAWAQQILQISGAPAPIEISILHRNQFTPWRHPTPYSFHFSEGWRVAIAKAQTDGNWQAFDRDDLFDPDLAGHFTMARRRGLCLAGAPIASVIPEVPWADYQDSILRDLSWACERADDNPVYLVLNACRIWAAVTARLVLSKAEGALWAIPRLPAELASIVTEAAEFYGGEPTWSSAKALSGKEALRVAQWIAKRLP
jgi:predicted nucleotidyltransferase